MNEIDEMLRLLETRSWLFSPSFIKRALAVFGHLLFVQLVLGFGWLLLAVLFGGL